VGIYMRAVTYGEKIGATKMYSCGHGDIGFDISSVKAELTVTNETISSAGVTLKIPVHAVTVSPSGSGKADATNTQALTYNLWPLEMEFQNLERTVPSKEELAEAPIAAVLLALREALAESAETKYGKQPCFTDYDPAKPGADAGNTTKLDLKFVRDIKGGLEISVGVLDLTASMERIGTSGNTLTVAFVQHGLAKLQMAKDKVDALCKYPKSANDKGCKDALDEYASLRKNGPIAVQY
jgi:hypothetical protein